MPRARLQQPKESIHLKKQEFVRHEIWVAAMDRFSAVGFDETTVDQIATAANVSRRTFFRYFSSKEDVMAAAMKGYGASLVCALQDQPKELTPLKAAQAVVRHVARLAADSPHAERLLKIAMESDDARKAQILEFPRIEDELGKAFARRGGHPEDHLPSHLLARVTLSVTQLSVTRWLQKQRGPIENVVDQAFSSLTQAFCPDAKQR